MNAPSEIKATTAPLKNVAAMLALVARVQDRPRHLPGIGAMFGWSGLGKSIATAHAANHYRGVLVEVRKVWTQKKFLEAVLTELGVRTFPRTAADMVELIAAQLLKGRKVLFVDEADVLLDRGYASVIQDIYESCKMPIILIGEERLSDKLGKIERLHNRVLEWVPAQPCDMEDAAHLRRLYCDKVKVADDLLARMVEATGGGARRVCVNLDRFREEAMLRGVEVADLAWWESLGLSFFTGEAPARGR